MISNENEYVNKLGELIDVSMTKYLVSLGLPLDVAVLLRTVILLLFVIGLSYLINKVTKYYIVHVIEKIIRKTKSKYDDYFIDRKVFQRLSHLAPAAFLYVVNDMVFRGFDGAVYVFENVILIYLVLIGVWTLTAFFSAVMDVYNAQPYSKDRPIKGYIQVVQIIGYFIGVMVIISIVFDVKLQAIFTGLGAVAAVLILVFKDTILGFVASIQLSANKMVRPGDWISMPSHKTDGTVLDISLNTVKIQNWDKTITTVPTYAMVSDSFSNWKGMEQSGGRRIKRSINIDMRSVKFCSSELIKRCKKMYLLKDYIASKELEILNYNKELQIDESVTANGRRLTNIGVFRKYLEVYLKKNPHIHDEMTFLVRHLQPTEKGIPIEIYVFSSDQAWARYEEIQADIFDHILAVLPEFELRVFQFPGGGDFNMQ